MKTYSDAVAFLYGLQTRGMKFGLRGIRLLLRTLGRPDRGLRCVHVAGSNGKGSTAAMIAATLTAAGYRTGLYTSPHLVDFTERIRIDGRPIPKKTVLRLARRMKKMIEEHRVTFFEAVTALAFQYFREEEVDIAVIETGLGGRLDATNVIRPLVSVITTVSLEHTELLGNSLRKIAYEKAGIVKPGVPCVSGVRSLSALRMIRSVCRQRGSRLIDARAAVVRVLYRELSGSVASIAFGGARISDLTISLGGLHQARNAVLAIATLQELALRGFKIHEETIRRGLGSISDFTGFQGRLSLIGRNPSMIVDVAHNVESLQALVKALRGLGVTGLHVVFGVMKDKPVRRMIRILAAVSRSIAAVQPGTNRSLASKEIESEFRRLRIPVFYRGPVGRGVKVARIAAGKKGTVLITGSHFVVGEALAALKHKKYLTINQ
ncbi:MAG: folylpolyglutamate synthase/dihydrofolate synthase family protein [Bacteroidota bacterium]